MPNLHKLSKDKREKSSKSKGPKAITFKKHKDCKGSVAFRATDEEAPVQSIYVNRPFADEWETCEITLTGSN